MVNTEQGIVIGNWYSPAGYLRLAVLDPINLVTNHQSTITIYSMKYWLVKQEPEDYSWTKFVSEGRAAWTGVRNFQARNYMRDGMKVGDLVLFYHSTSEPTGVYGIAKVVSPSHPDETSFDVNDEHYDPKAIMYQMEGKASLWECVDLEFVKKLARPITLAEIKKKVYRSQY